MSDHSQENERSSDERSEVSGEVEGAFGSQFSWVAAARAALPKSPPASRRSLPGGETDQILNSRPLIPVTLGAVGSQLSTPSESSMLTQLPCALHRMSVYLGGVIVFRDEIHEEPGTFTLEDNPEHWCKLMEGSEGRAVRETLIDNSVGEIYNRHLEEGMLTVIVTCLLMEGAFPGKDLFAIITRKARARLPSLKLLIRLTNLNQRVSAMVETVAAAMGLPGNEVIVNGTCYIFINGSRPCLIRDDNARDLWDDH